MTTYWASDLIERRGQGTRDVSALAYLVLNLTRAARLAADNDGAAEKSPCERMIAVREVLDVIEALTGMLIDGAETLEMRSKKPA